jgi:hypothetical protein
MEITVVGHGHSWLAQTLRLSKQGGKPGRTIQHRKLRVHMKVHEATHETSP